MQDVLVQEKELRALVIRKLTEAGLNAVDANTVADVLVHADLRGVRSHGVIRTEHYVTRLKAGSLNKNPSFGFKKLRDAAGLLDADDGMGHPALSGGDGQGLRAGRGYPAFPMVGIINGSHCPAPCPTSCSAAVSRI